MWPMQTPSLLCLMMLIPRWKANSLELRLLLVNPRSSSLLHLTHPIPPAYLVLSAIVPMCPTHSRPRRILPMLTVRVHTARTRVQPLTALPTRRPHTRPKARSILPNPRELSSPLLFATGEYQHPVPAQQKVLLEGMPALANIETHP